MYGERMPYIHRHVVCVCVSLCLCVSVCVSEQKGKSSCSTGGGLGDRIAIHSQRHGVCVCAWQKGEPSCSTGGVGRVLLPPWPARTVGKPQNRRGGGRGCRRKSTKPRRWGKGMPQKQRDILFHKRGARGEYTMTSITY